MSILLKDNPIVPFGKGEIEIKELSIIKLRSAKKDIIKLGQSLINKLGSLENMDTNNGEGIAATLDEIFDIALDMPYEICKVLTPEITKEQVEEATTRQIINFVTQAFEVNGFFILKNELGKMFQMIK